LGAIAGYLRRALSVGVYQEHNVPAPFWLAGRANTPEPSNDLSEIFTRSVDNLVDNFVDRCFTQLLIVFSKHSPKKKMKIKTLFFMNLHTDPSSYVHPPGSGQQLVQHPGITQVLASNCAGCAAQLPYRHTYTRGFEQ
jgi:hypothetical protein